MNILNALDLRVQGDNAFSANDKTLRREARPHAALGGPNVGGISHKAHVKFIDGGTAERLCISEIDQLSASRGQRIESGNIGSSHCCWIRIVYIVVIEVIICRKLAPALAGPVDAQARLVIPYLLALRTRRKFGGSSVGTRNVPKQILGWCRPGVHWNHGSRENARARSAILEVVRLTRVHGVTEFLRKKSGKIGPAYHRRYRILLPIDGLRRGKRAGLINEIARLVSQRRDRYQPGIDALNRPSSLIVAEEKHIVLHDRSADRAAELVLIEL